jgi:hypothetical protein
MSVAGISTVSPYMPPQGPSGSNSGTTRVKEDQAASQLIQDLENGDLKGAEQAYNTLSSFGPNNSGPWGSGQMQNDFLALGQDLQSGNLSGAKSEMKTLAGNQLKADMTAVEQDQAGNSPNYQQAIANYQSDYWAVFGTAPQSGGPLNPGTVQMVNPGGISVTA